MNSYLLGAFLAVEVLLVLAVDVTAVTHPAGGRVDLVVFDPRHLAGPALGAVLVTVTTAYVGFEGGPLYSEEVRDPRRTVPVATYLSLGLMAVLYSGSTWAMSLAVGSDRIVAEAAEHGPTLMFTMVAGHLGGPALVTGGQVLLLSSAFAGMLSYHNAVARYAFALGRERVLPAGFGHTVPSTGAPAAGSIAQSGVGLVAIVACAALGADPMVTLFFRLGVTGGLGVLILLATTSFAVVGFFLRDPHGESLATRLVAPLLAGVALTGVLVAAVANYARLLGVSGTSGWRWGLPAAYVVVLAFGVLYGHVLSRYRPSVFARIGLGANAATGRFSPVAQMAAPEWGWTR